ALWCRVSEASRTGESQPRWQLPRESWMRSMGSCTPWFPGGCVEALLVPPPERQHDAAFLFPRVAMPQHRHVAWRAGFVGVALGLGGAFGFFFLDFPAVAASRRHRVAAAQQPGGEDRSEEHTSELQSRENLVC